MPTLKPTPYSQFSDCGISAAMTAFGDDFSDVGMLRFCGTGAAVANAIPEALAAADVVVGDNNHDGPARYLAQRFLGETP